MRKRKYVRRTGSTKPGRPAGDVGELAAREGISRQAAWWRLRRSTGNPVGRPKKVLP